MLGVLAEGPQKDAGGPSWEHTALWALPCSDPTGPAAAPGMTPTLVPPHQASEGRPDWPPEQPLGQPQQVSDGQPPGKGRPGMAVYLAARPSQQSLRQEPSAAPPGRWMSKKPADQDASSCTHVSIVYCACVARACRVQHFRGGINPSSGRAG